MVNGIDYLNNGNFLFVFDGYAYKKLCCIEFEFFMFFILDVNVFSGFSFVFFD